MTPQRIAITGSSGMIGGALSAYLRERGDVVIRLVRREPVKPLEARLPGPSDDQNDLIEVLESVDGIINLAGAGIGDHRWSDGYKEKLRSSRLNTTHTLTEALSRVDRPVRYVSGSATGYYGNRGEEVLTEASSKGHGFLSDLVESWEAAAATVAPHHPVAFARTGLVISAQGGAFQRLALATKFGLGGPLGSGQQWWSWISLRDEVRALAFLLDSPELTGPFNLTAPRASRQIELSQALGRSMLRPSIMPAPEIALKTVLGEMSSEVLSSARVHPERLEQAGFEWVDANQDQVLDRLVSDLK